MMTNAPGAAAGTSMRYVPTAVELAQQAERDATYARQNALSIAIADQGDPTTILDRARAYADFLVNG